MIKDSALLRTIEESFMRKEGPLPFERAVNIFTSLWIEARDLGILPLKDPFEGIDVDIRIAKILNSCLKNSSQD
ncbi:MAG: hypothetical protein ACK415_07515 [Thermodesulfovibrionales bacterium]